MGEFPKLRAIGWELVVKNPRLSARGLEHRLGARVVLSWENAMLGPFLLFEIASGDVTRQNNILTRLELHFCFCF